MCCFSQLSLLTEQLAHLIRIDPFVILPREISLKILGHLDATSLCRAAQVTRKWRSLADDDVLWRGICEQHIGQKCRKCGWGLPVLEKKRNFCPQSGSPSPPPPTLPLPLPSYKRSRDDYANLLTPPSKRQRRHSPSHSSSSPSMLTRPLDTDPSSALLVSSPSCTPSESLTRPWKDVYSERMTIERNWRRGRCTVRTLQGHTDGIMCLQFNETLSHPAFPVLITGSYDRTVRVWNLETGVELHCLKGHERAVRALQFDEAKLITGSMDRTLKVWDWRSGKCIRTLTGHSEGVVSLNFDSNVLASGSVDSTIKVWNLRTGGAFTLRGHSDWVNAVQLWDSNGPTRPSSTDVSLLDVSGVLSSSSSSGAEIDAGKMLFSASDDGTIKMWDLTSRMCIRTIAGHVAQVQSMKLLFASDCNDELSEASARRAMSSPSPSTSSGNRKKPLLISGSLDNTIKLWDIETGKSVQTFFGHIEGVWAVASDKLRLVSGSHDRTIKVSQLLFETVDIRLTFCSC
jgi:F-box and WD-40 domain protein MET30